MTEIYVLMPTKGRAKQAEAMVNHLLWLECPSWVNLHVILTIPEDDHETCAIDVDPQRVVKIARPVGTTAVEGWNQAYRFAKTLGAEWVVLGADDLEFCDGWLEEALKAAENGAQVIGLNDGHSDPMHYGSHHMVTVRFIEKHRGGWFIPPVYRSWWFDREICEHAQALGLYAAAHDARIIHHHPDWEPGKWDRTYEEAWHHHEPDRRIYEQRKAAGWLVAEGVA